MASLQLGQVGVLNSRMLALPAFTSSFTSATGSALTSSTGAVNTGFSAAAPSGLGPTWVSTDRLML